MRFKLYIEYAGTRYSGWQIQKNARTVQGEIDKAVGRVTGRRDFELYGSGRTDAGVHALEQVAHLDVQTKMTPEEIVLAVNDELPADINILHAQPVPHRFHARHDAVARSYLYQIARRRTAFAKPYVWWVKDRLDTGAMQEIAASFRGMHDFQSFSDADPDEVSTAVQVERVEIAEADELLLLRVEGSHFIWRMVRRMVGVLVEAGRGTIGSGEVEKLLSPGKAEASSGKAKASPYEEHAQNRRVPLTAPASGLFLERVFYPGDRRDYPLTPPLFMLG